ATGLGDYLKAQGVTELWVMGIATDYCVKFTVLDALELGFKVNLIEDACRGVNLQAGDVHQAVTDMQNKGASLVQSQDI
ncbi:MAG: isochorismatase family protein, partial [Haliscomenobacter sp.]|uniref:isochorismatase family protein n=1 Tax=Haliscomenobacter sp. TaxID=2717303 RepID=UPI0029A0CC80